MYVLHYPFKSRMKKTEIMLPVTTFLGMERWLQLTNHSRDKRHNRHASWLPLGEAGPKGLKGQGMGMAAKPPGA